MESMLLKQKQMEESCGTIIWKKDKGKIKFLVLHRADEDNVWEPAKGHRLPQETEKETALRELHEELGLTRPIFDKEFREILEYENSKGKIIRYVFFLVNTENIELSEEHDSYKWIELEELPSYFEYKDIRSIYRKAAKRLKDSTL